MSTSRTSPTVLTDFTVPTDGQESPWGMAKLVFMHDGARSPSRRARLTRFPSMPAENPGRFTYPQPPNFHGSTFLKQILATTIDDPDNPHAVRSTNRFRGAGADRAALSPISTRCIRASGARARPFRRTQPTCASCWRTANSTSPLPSIRPTPQARLPTANCRDTVRTFVLDGGTIGNTHFVAIPFNSLRQGRRAWSSPISCCRRMAQSRKQDPVIWGDPTVLNVAALPANEKALFDTLDLGPATLTPEELGPVLPEPHPSWVSALEEAWTARYGAD
jgi:putative thiamine transport system substrate-binding protein